MAQRKTFLFLFVIISREFPSHGIGLLMVWHMQILGAFPKDTLLKLSRSRSVKDLHRRPGSSGNFPAFQEREMGYK